MVCRMFSVISDLVTAGYGVYVCEKPLLKCLVVELPKEPKFCTGIGVASVEGREKPL